MSMIHTGLLGSKVVSWRRSNPRDLLKRIIETNPGATRAQLVSAVRDVASVDEMDSIIEFWVVNTRRALLKRPEPSKEEIRARVEQIKNTISARLLDMILPNGKPLRDCTGSECAQVGGWLTKIANRVKPNDVVGTVLTETQVRKLCMRATTHRKNR